MTKELIDKTFAAAVDVIFWLWNTKRIDRVELQVRFERARMICQEEYKKALGLRASVDGRQ